MKVALQYFIVVACPWKKTSFGDDYPPPPPPATPSKTQFVFYCLAVSECYIKSIQPNFIDAMDCINLGPCNSYFEFAQTEQDISDPCVMNVRQAQRNNYNSEAATQETLHQINSWQFKLCNVFCIVLHQINPHQLFLMYVMLSAPMVCLTFRFFICIYIYIYTHLF